MRKGILALFYLSAIIFLMVLNISSCKKPEQVMRLVSPQLQGISTVILQCVNTNAPYDTTTTLWRFLSNSDTVSPDTTHAILNFRKNSIYKCQLFFLNERKTTNNGTTNLTALVQYNTFNINKIPSTTVNVTNEIREMQNYYLICFNMTGGVTTNLSITRTDYDTNTPPLQVGLNDNITTLDTSNGRMEVTLYCQFETKNGTCGPDYYSDFDIFYSVNIN